jgi:hypothetical protein
VNTWASGASGVLTGVVFFPNDILNRALIASSQCCVRTIVVSNATSISTNYSFPFVQYIKQIGLSPSGAKAIFVASNNNLITYLNASPTNLSAI